MEPFAGWDMPIQYPSGILAEHRHTRAAAGLFDVSHMGQMVVRAKSGVHGDAARALESLVPVDLLSLPPGRQRYAFLTNETGGIDDDLMIANLGDCWYLVVNAARTATDAAYLRTRLSEACTIEMLDDRTLLAIQGPDSAGVICDVVAAAGAMRFMDAAVCSIDGAACFITRSGYTGEDGFELSVPASHASRVAERLLAHASVRLVGLGARDSLRLEAGLCLHGHDLDEGTTPVEAGLEWAIQPARRAGGSRRGGFIGAEVILSQLERGAARKRVGLRAQRRPVREGATLLADEASEVPVGRVTSGTFGPSAGFPVAMGYVPSSMARIGTRLVADVRGQRVAVIVSELPFVPHRYQR